MPSCELVTWTYRRRERIPCESGPKIKGSAAFRRRRSLILPLEALNSRKVFHVRFCIMTPISISEFPLEMLQCVLSWCLLYESSDMGITVEYYTFLLTLFRLRHVCRAFRWAVDSLSFWLNEKFDFHTFICLVKGQKESRLLQLVKVLLEDQVLMEHLQTKSAWTLSNEESPELVRLISSTVPNFVQNARKIILNMKTPRLSNSHAPIINQTVRLLSKCQNLKSLHLQISNSRGLLSPPEKNEKKKTKKQKINSHHDVLHCFSTLEEFHFSAHKCCPGKITDFLPSNSAGTLTHLTFDNHGRNTEGITETEFAPLNTFVNLKHLKMNPISWQFCRYLSRCPIRLESFHGTGTEYHFLPDRMSLVEMFSTTVFQSLKNLTLDFWPAFSLHPSKSTIFQDVIGMITNLSYLESVNLKMPLEIAWCAQFSSLMNLRKLKWVTERQHMFVNGRKPWDDINWKQCFKQEFRMHLPRTCHLELSISVVHYEHDPDSDYWDSSYEYSAFSDSDQDAEEIRDAQRAPYDEPGWSARKRKEYGRNYSSNHGCSDPMLEYYLGEESCPGCQNCNGSGESS